jgi:eukaryotic-like serine/threonine-protein kinase
MKPGDSLGPYRVLEKLGEGGMGAVYRARDARLQRDVAIKVLPENFAADADRLARFAREAQALAALNHPNIAQIYGVLDDPGIHGSALVMELVEGEDLSIVMARGPLPPPDALAIAAQIAAALEAAHDHGIVHRDLKPANVKMRADGTVKILDFGLAKVVDPGPGSNVDAMVSPTFTSPAVTARGVILGTAAYMAPEQARGKAADARADIWAFGVILYEMLTGRRLFDGTEASDVIASVLRDGPNWEALPASTPVPVRLLLRRCLQKDPKHRLRHAGDARLEVTDAAASSEPESTGVSAEAASVQAASARVASAFRRKIRLAWTLAGVAIALALAVASYAVAGRSALVADVAVRKWIVPQESGDQDDAWARENISAISPDGRHLAYVDGSRLRIRDLASLDSRAMEAAGPPGMPVWSPDSAHVAFFVDGQSLWRAPVAGGPAAKICDLPAGIVLGAAWRADRTILINLAYGPAASDFFRVSETGGRPEKWLLPGTDPALPPVAFNLRGLPDGSLVYSMNRAKGTVRMLQRGDQPPRELPLPPNGGVAYSPSGHLLYSRSDNTRGIFAVPFDLARGVVTGEQFRVAETGVFPSVSGDGTLVYGLPRPGLRQLVWVDRDGTPGAWIGQPQDSMWAPSISPDGTRVAVAGVENGRPAIWTHEIARSAKSRVTSPQGVAVDPAWHPTEARIAFQTGNWNLSAVSTDGSDQRSIVSGPRPEYSPSWSRDGRYLVFGRFDAETKGDIWMLESGATEPKPVFSTTVIEETPVLSPDGRHIAYISHETGRREVFVRTFPAGQGRTQVSFAGGTSPRWSPRGSEIFFAEANALMAAAVRTSPALAFDTPKRLFDLEDRDLNLRQYDTADGKQFVVVRTIRPSRNGVAIVQNWMKEFAR